MDVRILGLPQLSPSCADLDDGHARSGDAVQHWTGRDHDDLCLLQGEPNDATRDAGPAIPVVRLELRLVVQRFVERVRFVIRRLRFVGRRRGRCELLIGA
jgi:hypothetical protein